MEGDWDVKCSAAMQWVWFLFAQCLMSWNQFPIHDTNTPQFTLKRDSSKKLRLWTFFYGRLKLFPDVLTTNSDRESKRRHSQIIRFERKMKDIQWRSLRRMREKSVFAVYHSKVTLNRVLLKVEDVTNN